MCILKNVLIIVFIYTETNGHISWTLHTKPAVFGQDIQLVCDLTSDAHCCSRYTRKWVKDWTYDVVTINKASSNIWKYEECLNSSSSTSILTIKSFDEEYVNIPYECTYGFDTFSKVLNIKYFEYHPEEKFPDNLTIYKNYVEANITMKKFYPIPKCNATDGVNDLKQNLNVTSESNGLFFTSNIHLLYDIRHSCQETIVVICMVGQTPFTVVNHTLPCLLDLEIGKAVYEYQQYAVNTKLAMKYEDMAKINYETAHEDVAGLNLFYLDFRPPSMQSILVDYQKKTQ
ncbi:unnamed protein product [Mytilus coruscus]|uniref:Ig-like domain-containing protein n=1 Tax=Mytilus coruscus TaxID=42192 RepID=A0A6J8EKV6_MYTCO|nr:unnamed protein product [Mytilus coruscus]